MATIAIDVKTIIGVGISISASSGDNMVAVLAATLQIPKAVPAKMAGKSRELPR